MFHTTVFANTILETVTPCFFQHYRISMLIAIVYIKEMLPLRFAVVYGTHEKYGLSYWPNKKSLNSGDDAVCGLNKADKACASSQPIKDSRVDKTEQECDQLDKWTTVVRKKRWCHKSGNAPDAEFQTVEIFVSRLKPDTRIVYLKKWYWDKFQNARSVRFQALRTRYDTYASFKISAKLFDEGDINDVLNCWKRPQELKLECQKCPLVTRFKPRFWYPNRCLVPPTSSDNEPKWKGY